MSQAANQRQRNWRIALTSIILVTLPFYCVGIFLWGTASPGSGTGTPTATPGGPIVVTATLLPTVTPTVTPQGFIPSITPLAITPQFPTQIIATQFIPSPFPTITPIQPTRFLSPTPNIVPPTAPPVILPTQQPLPTPEGTPLPFLP